MSPNQMKELTKPVDVFPLPIPGISGLSSAAGSAEKHREGITAQAAGRLETSLRAYMVNARRA